MLLQLAAPLLALTTCMGDRPITMFAPAVAMLDSVDMRVILIHEATHRRQLVGDCPSLLESVRASWRVRLTYEAEAYCAGEAVRRATPRTRKATVAALLARAVPEASGSDVGDAVDRWCR